jgi:hypothetical protein
VGGSNSNPSSIGNLSRTRAGADPSGIDYNGCWLRSPYANDSVKFLDAGSEGYTDYGNDANQAGGVAPAFCF